jgi:hypothetical protein
MIYRLDKEKNRIVPCEETDFKSNNILERQNIEKWIENYPDILGEELLVITTEYDKFDKTNERLDILALDKDGNLVIIELKRDDSGKYVDLQAVKYAAYCSTLQLDDICLMYQTYSDMHGKKLSDDQSRVNILNFIDDEEFEEINDRPRIILVARQFRPEVTASVLWLRKFGIDLSCVRLSPYDLGDGNIAFESNIIIPLPEARDFIIETEKKDSRTKTVSQVEYLEFYKELVRCLKGKIDREYSSPQPKYYYQIPTGIGGIHFEWSFHGRPRSSFCVELHFEKGSHATNLEILSKIQSRVPQLEKFLQEQLIIQKEWGENWSRLYIEKNEGQFTEELKEWAVDKMAKIINELQPVFDEMDQGGG